jgi:putative hemolysin
MKSNRHFWVILIALAVIAAGAALFFIRGNEDTWLCQDGQWVRHGSPAKPMPTTPCGDLNVEPPAANANVSVQIANPASTNCLEKGGKLEGRIDETGGQYSLCIFQDDTRCEEWAYFRNECQSGKNIAVFSPKAGQTVSLPLTIIGQARVFESSFVYRLKDLQGNIVAAGSAMAASPDMGKFGDFNITIKALFQKPTAESLILDVYDLSAKDGSEIDLVSIPLLTKLPETTSVNVYFSNNRLDPEVTCTKVFPVKRIIAKTPAIGQAALEALLAGPSKKETDIFYQTNINIGTKLNSLTIVDGTATADFDETLQSQVGGSCRVGAIGAQIRETLRQFPTVKNVIISVNGRTEDVLQP